MQTLPYLIAEMRSMGVRRLELELEPASDTTPAPALEPEEPVEDKPEGACAFPGCSADRAGLFGGATAAKYCRAHALAEAGVKL